MERAGVVSHSTRSPWAAPLHMVKKLGLNEWRRCSDFLNLNLRTITDSYVIPHLHSLNFQLKGKQVFSRLDLVKGFQVPVNKASRAKTAVVTPFGTFKFNFMPFGLKMQDQLFKGLWIKFLGI